MINSIYLVSKFHETKKGVTLYFAKGSCPDVWTTDKMQSKIYTLEQDALDVAKKYKAFISTIPVII